MFHKVSLTASCKQELRLCLTRTHDHHSSPVQQMWFLMLHIMKTTGWTLSGLTKAPQDALLCKRKVKLSIHHGLNAAGKLPSHGAYA